MLLGLWPNYWEDWESYHLVTFDGINRTITINSQVHELNVKEDIYSAWKEWMVIRDNSKFPPAFRAIGGDPVGSGLNAGDIYFLINQWQIVVPQNVRVNGVIYHDEAPLLEPFIVLPGGGVISTVSNLVQTATFSEPLDYQRMVDAVVEGTNNEAVRLQAIEVTLDNVKTLIENGDVDLTEVLYELSKVGKKVDDTQAMVLSGQ
jgi:hypothetical protein